MAVAPDKYAQPAWPRRADGHEYHELVSIRHALVLVAAVVPLRNDERGRREQKEIDGWLTSGPYEPAASRMWLASARS